MTNKQPEALRLADVWDGYLPAYHYGQIADDTAAELRRLHALNAELVEALRKVANLDDRPMLASEVIDLARAAISKAEAQQ